MQLGRFQVQGELARGGFGRVLRALDPATGREVAIKTLLAGANANESHLRRFEREAQALARLQHPALVRVLEAGRSQRGPWLALELVPGETLEERVLREGPLSLPDALDLARQLAAGLEAAHQRGIAHRDVKPNNVLLQPDGRAVLVDFGLTKDLEVEESIRLSRTGAVQGTPGFWSPEQAMGRPAGLPSDVFSYGATLYWALTGELPCPGDSFFEAMTATLRAPPRPPRELRPDLPPRLEAFLLRCLAKEPAARFADAGALVLALDEAERAGAAAPAAPPRLPLALALGSLLAAAGLGAWAGSSPANASPTPGAESSQRQSSQRQSSQRQSSPSQSSPSQSSQRQSSPSQSSQRQSSPSQSSPSQSSPSQHVEPSAGLAAGPAPLERAQALIAAGEPEAARALLLPVAEGGEGEACLAVARLSAERPGEVEAWLERATRDPETRLRASLALARHLIARGRYEARRWLRELPPSAEVDELLGESYYGAVPRDLAQAERLLTRAAAAGRPRAHYLCGRMAARGQGRPQDQVAARRHFEAAAEAGVAAAMTRLGNYHDDGSGGLREDVEAAARWYRRAAEAGDLPGMAAWGTALREGFGVPADRAGGAAWLRRAARAGDPRGMLNHGIALLSGKDLPRDEPAGARWVQRAAEAGYSEAMYGMARLYLRGWQGQAPDPRRARSWLQQAADAGHDQAIEQLRELR